MGFKILLLLISILTTHCGSVSQSNNGQRRGGYSGYQATDSNDPMKKSSKPKSQSQKNGGTTEDGDDDEDETVIPPTLVSGAFLTCQFDASYSGTTARANCVPNTENAVVAQYLENSGGGSAVAARQNGQTFVPVAGYEQFEAESDHFTVKAESRGQLRYNVEFQFRSNVSNEELKDSRLLFYLYPGAEPNRLYLKDFDAFQEVIIDGIFAP